MSSSPPLEPIDREWLAAEHALRLLDGHALIEARRLEASDPAFAAEVARWSERLAPLFNEIDPVEVPARVFEAIEQRLSSRGNVIEMNRSVRRWKFATAGMTALAASLALAILIEPQQVSPPTRPAATSQPMVAMLEGGRNRLVATWNGDKDLMIVPAVVAAAAPDHVHELWMIPKGGQPKSMGVMPAGPMRLTVQPAVAALLVNGATFAVSVEPSGGSPTGQPTGPVIASGPLVRA